MALAPLRGGMFIRMLEDDRRRAGWSVGTSGMAARREHPRVPGDRGRRALAERGDVRPDLRAVRLAADVRDGSVAAVAQGRMLVLPSHEWIYGLTTSGTSWIWWVLGGLPVGFLLLVGGARAAGAALAGSSICSFLAYLLKRTYGGENLETLVQGAVIAGERRLDRVRPRRARFGNPRPAGSIPHGAGLSDRHRRGRDAGGPQDPRGSGSTTVRRGRASGGSRSPGSRCCSRST